MENRGDAIGEAMMIAQIQECRQTGPCRRCSGESGKEGHTGTARQQ
jgi:hypothetical protein